jgi:hypothetical protein
MRRTFSPGLALLLAVALQSAGSAHAQPTAETLRAEREKLTQVQKDLAEEFDAAMAKERDEWERKLREKQQAEHQAFAKRHAELAAKIAEIQERERVLQRQAEAKKLGFFARLEIKGRLEKRTHPELNLFTDLPPTIWWEIDLGEVLCRLDFGHDAALQKSAEALNGKIVLATGLLVKNGQLTVQSLKPAVPSKAAATDDVPPKSSRKHAITILKGVQEWLYIYTDGAGTVGYGAGGSYQGHFKAGTFDVEQVAQQLKKLPLDEKGTRQTHFLFLFESDRNGPEDAGPTRYTRDETLIPSLFERAVEASGMRKTWQLPRDFGRLK